MFVPGGSPALGTLHMALAYTQSNIIICEFRYLWSWSVVAGNGRPLCVICIFNFGNNKIDSIKLILDKKKIKNERKVEPFIVLSAIASRKNHLNSLVAKAFACGCRWPESQNFSIMKRCNGLYHQQGPNNMSW